MKRNSKRLVAVLLSAGLCAGALSGCGAESAATAETGTETQPETEQEVTRTTEEPAEAEAEEEWSDVFVEPVAGISDDFIRGMDASAVLSVEKSGAKYYGYDGKEQDVFETLAESVCVSGTIRMMRTEMVTAAETMMSQPRSNSENAPRSMG